MNILVVDDEKLITQGIKQILQETKIGLATIATASSAEEAIQVFHKIKPAIVLSDIRMPGMSGLALISQLKQTSIPFKSIIISSYDDFEYAKEGILLGIENYLIKPVNHVELISTINTTIQKIKNERITKQLWTSNEREIFKDNFLRRILQQSLSIDDYQNWEELLTPFKKWSKLAVTTISLIDNASIEEKEQLLRTLTKAFPSIEHVNLSTSELVLIYDAKTISVTAIKQVIVTCAILPDIFVTFGSSVDTIENIHHSYEQSQKLQPYSLVFGLGQFIAEQDIKKDYPFTEEIITQEELAHLIHDSNLANIRQKLQKLEQHITDSSLGPTDIQNITIGIGLMLHRIAADMGIASHDEVSELRLLMEKITKQKTTKQIFLYLLMEIQAVIAKMTYSETSYSPVIQRILKLINQDLSLHHSLKTLANEFNMNSAYLGQLFQKEVGTGFNQYCHHQRMKQANEQIIHSTEKISDIAKSMGYDDVSYFYRLYKKDYGFTPNKVRANKLLYKK
ncbi:response regulator [Vagococcus sp. BWB3-3]|uniref:Response regulator n=1 Tax=Vagococcus allomyrinae TaxID=2794353 RepID=A0A940PA54_9ENTE|nr:response regulator [Vagococcus allomyrinae]MBP1039666.1 response regulator [Vagococcus allomyrinae]